MKIICWFAFTMFLVSSCNEQGKDKNANEKLKPDTISTKDPRRVPLDSIDAVLRGNRKDSLARDIYLNSYFFKIESSSLTVGEAEIRPSSFRRISADSVYIGYTTFIGDSVVRAELNDSGILAMGFYLDSRTGKIVAAVSPYMLYMPYNDFVDMANLNLKSKQFTAYLHSHKVHPAFLRLLGESGRVN